jgi:broad specificity phosphatase PhoE
MKVYLVRHGDVDDPAVYTTGLTPKGVKQIAEICRKLNGFKGFIYTSPYRRCHQTAAMIGEFLGTHYYNIRNLGEVGTEPDETLEDAFRRGVKCFEQLKRNGQDMILVSHGGPIQGIALHLGHPTGACDRGEVLEFDV